jgi:hypothetical protein
MSKDSGVDFNDYFRLMGLRLIVQMRSLVEFSRVALRYYPNLKFCKIDLSLLTLYFAHNPFSISKDFLQRKGEKEVYAYGETPLTTMDHISKECQITPQDTVFELGSGRGRACFWLNTFIGCKVVGIEYIPEFVKRANTIKTRFEIEDVEFRQQDMLNTDYSNATVVYLYGTNLEDSAIQKLVEKFQALASGTKIITISYSLNEYTSQPIFEVMKHFTAPFPWGMADVYLQIKK